MQIVMRTPFILLLNQAAEHSAQSTLEIYSLFFAGVIPLIRNDSKKILLQSVRGVWLRRARRGYLKGQSGK